MLVKEAIMRRLHRRRRRRVSKGIRHKCRGICLCCMWPTVPYPPPPSHSLSPASSVCLSALDRSITRRKCPLALCVVYATCAAWKCEKCQMPKWVGTVGNSYRHSGAEGGRYLRVCSLQFGDCKSVGDIKFVYCKAVEWLIHCSKRVCQTVVESIFIYI